MPPQYYWRPLKISTDVSLYSPSEAPDVPASNNNSAASYPNAVLTHSNVFSVAIDPALTSHPGFAVQNYFQLVHFYTHPWAPAQNRPLKLTVIGQGPSKRFRYAYERRYSRPTQQPLLTELSTHGFGDLTLALIVLEYADTREPWPFFLDSLCIKFFPKADQGVVGVPQSAFSDASSSAEAVLHQGMV